MQMILSEPGQRASRAENLDTILSKEIANYSTPIAATEIEESEGIYKRNGTFAPI